jgi:hypothetical protein
MDIAFRMVHCQANIHMQMREPHKALGFRVEPVFFNYIIPRMRVEKFPFDQTEIALA